MPIPFRATVDTGESTMQLVKSTKDAMLDILSTSDPTGAGRGGFSAPDLFVSGSPPAENGPQAIVSLKARLLSLCKLLTMFSHKLGGNRAATISTLLRLMTGYFDKATQGEAVRRMTGFGVEDGCTCSECLRRFRSLVSSVNGDERPTLTTSHMVMEKIR